MKITVIYGNARRGCTWNAVRLFKEEIEKAESCEVREFYLPKDMPDFCRGCFTCFLKGEGACPHAESVQTIASAIKEADMIVLSSPVYALDVSGAMKALLDHLCYMWVSHRPDPAMFGKVGVVFCTTAGAGLGHTAKTMKNSLKFWCVKRVYTFKKALGAMSWEDVSEKNKAATKAKARRLAARAVRAVRRADRILTPVFTKILFSLMRGMMKKNTWNETDRRHWEALGWLAGKKPY